jgi:hypothetical protein
MLESDGQIAQNEDKYGRDSHLILI